MRQPLYFFSMADQTQKMISLLGRMRKQMNGAVADAMYYYGQNYGLNYGVSLPTIREIASTEGKDHSLAQYLYKQQVRELRLAALHIADPSQLSCEEASTWAEGIINSEVAEEMAFAVLSLSPHLAAIFHTWSSSDNEMLAYAALMAVARRQQTIDVEIITSIKDIVRRHSSSRIIAQGAVALLSAAAQNAELTTAIKESLTALGEGSTADYIREEMEWRLEALQ